MSFLRNIFSRGLTSSARPAPKPAKRFQLPAEWKPACTMKRVILHWTGGAYTASSHDRDCYHMLVQGDLSVARGHRSIKDNVNISGKDADHYAAHTRGCNTGSIGVSICSMGGAEEIPFRAGKYPLTEAQWQKAAEVVADLCRAYSIPVTNKTVLTHAEVEPNLGIWQRAKWDMSRLAFDLNTKGAKACGDDFRKRVMEAMK